MKSIERTIVIVLAVLCIWNTCFIVSGIQKQSKIDSKLIEYTSELTIDKFNSRFPVLVERVIGSVVHVQNVTQGWQGSGVAISEDIILTARHVNERGDKFIITLNNSETVEATRAISHKKYDIGFIKINKPTLTPAKLGLAKDCKLGQDVFAIGSPYGKQNFNSVTRGIVSGINRDWSDLGDYYGWKIVFTTDSAGHPGNSGCPVFTMDGRVRGILVGGYSPVLICVIPVDLVLSDLEEVEQMFVEDMYYIEENTQEVQYGDEY